MKFCREELREKEMDMVKWSDVVKSQFIYFNTRIRILEASCSKIQMAIVGEKISKRNETYEV